MAQEQQLAGNLSEHYITQTLRARREQGRRKGPKGEDESDSYMVSFGDTAHPAWMRVWPEGGGIALESDWGSVQVEGITQVGTRRGQLLLESPQEGERLVVEISPTGMWQARREVLADSTTGEAPGEAGPGVQHGAPEHAAAARVTLRGRVGRAVRFRETPQVKRLVGSFSLGVHPDEVTTHWYTVVVFGAWAQRLQEHPLTVGQEVEVVGYPHTRERRGRDGSIRREQQIYAAAVRTTLGDPPPSTRQGS